MNCPTCNTPLHPWPHGNEFLIVSCPNSACRNISSGTGQTVEQAEANFRSEFPEETKCDCSLNGQKP